MKLLITGAWQGAQEHIPEIERMGHEVVFMQWEKDELPCPPDEIEGVICNGLFMNHDIEKFTSLKYIQLTSAGLDRVPLDYIKSHNIELHNARGVYSIPMAEFAIGGVLNLYKQSRFFMKNQQARKWEKNRCLMELFGKTVCIVGCGSVGTECAKRFKAFGCEVIGVDIAPRTDISFDRIDALSELDRILPTADILVLTVPLTNETRYLINKERISLMKPSAVLVNIARGAVVETSALTEALQENKLGGAVLDVFEDEPLSDNSPLWDIENVVVSAHCSFVGEKNGDRLSFLIIDRLRSSKNVSFC